MKKHIITLTLILTLARLDAVAQETKYYYYFDQKIFLEEIVDSYIITIDVESKNKNSSYQLEQYENREKIGLGAYLIKLSKKEANDLRYSIGVIQVMPAYKTMRKDNVFCSNHIVLKKKNGASVNEVQKIFKANSLYVHDSLLSSIVLSKDKFTNDENCLNLSNRLYETGLFEFCHPEFYAYGKLNQFIPTDEYFSNQWYLHNTGQGSNFGLSSTADADIDAPEAWDITRGTSDIVVAVIDEGVTSNHPDLPNSRQVRLNGSNFGSLGGDGTNINNPSPTANDNHGNACAGVIAATHNNQGIAGIAPNCQIMPIRMAFDLNTTAHFASAIDFAVSNGAHVISNSWGGGAPSADITNAITNAVTNGRAGRGCVVVFAAGNPALNNNVPPIFPANSSTPGVICVGASDRNDVRALYSPEGNNMDIVAPSHRQYNIVLNTESFEIWTIDIPGGSGYNPQPATPAGGTADVLIPDGTLLPSTGTNSLSYTGRFGGTSAACPQVAAVAALMLSVNPCLTAVEIEIILKRNADKVGGVTYTNGHNSGMGFGRLNAHRALTDWLFVSNETINNGDHFSLKSSGTIFVENTTIHSGGILNLIAGRSIDFRTGNTSHSGSFTHARLQQFSQPLNCSVWDEITMISPDKIQDDGEIDYNTGDLISSNSTLNENLPVKNHSHLVVYPNPNNGTSIFVVSNHPDISSFEIIDKIGKLVLSNTNMPKTTNILFKEQLSKGLYVIKVFDSNGMLVDTAKFVVY
jgi:subtilisin family serine protease